MESVNQQYAPHDPYENQADKKKKLSHLSGRRQYAGVS